MTPLVARARMATGHRGSSRSAQSPVASGALSGRPRRVRRSRRARALDAACCRWCRSAWRWRWASRTTSAICTAAFGSRASSAIGVVVAVVTGLSSAADRGRRAGDGAADQRRQPLDGLDGLASGTAVASSRGLRLRARRRLSGLAAALAASLGGFLLWNRPPASHLSRRRRQLPDRCGARSARDVDDRVRRIRPDGGRCCAARRRARRRHGDRGHTALAREASAVPGRPRPRVRPTRRSQVVARASDAGMHRRAGELSRSWPSVSRAFRRRRGRCGRSCDGHRRRGVARLRRSRRQRRPRDERA